MDSMDLTKILNQSRSNSVSFGCLWTCLDFIPLSVHPRSGRPHCGAQCDSIGAGNIGGATSRFQGAARGAKNCKKRIVIFSCIIITIIHNIGTIRLREMSIKRK